MMRFLSGHTKDVRGVAFLPDGRLVSVSSDKTTRLWDLAGGTSSVLVKARGPLYSVATSPDGRLIAVAGRHGTNENPVTIFELVNNSPKKYTWEVFDDVFSFDPTTGQLNCERRLVNRSIWSLSFSNDGNQLALAGRKLGGGKIPNGGGGMIANPTRWHESMSLLDVDAYAIKYSPVAPILAVTILGQVRFIIDHRNSFAVPIQCDWAPAVEFVSGINMAIIAAGSFLNVVNLGDVKKQQSRVKTGIRAVTALAATPDGRSLLVGGKPGQVDVFDLTQSVPVRRTSYDFDIGGVHGLAASHDGMTFAVAGDKGLLICDFDS